MRFIFSSWKKSQNQSSSQFLFFEGKRVKQSEVSYSPSPSRSLTSKEASFVFAEGFRPCFFGQNFFRRRH